MFRRLIACMALGVAAAWSCSFASDPIWAKDPRSDTPLFRVLQNGKVGYIDRSGKIVIAPRYKSFYLRSAEQDFFNGTLIVGATWISAKGQERRVAETTWNTPLVEGVAIESVAEMDWLTFPKKRLLDAKGNVLAIVKATWIDAFSEGLAAYGEPRWLDLLPGFAPRVPFRGYLDRRGNVAIPATFAYAGPFREGLAAVAVNGKCSVGWGLPAPSAPAVASGCGGLMLDTAVTIPPCAHGYIDKSGNYKIAPRFEMAQDFSEHRAGVQKGGKWGFIDPVGTEIIRPKYEAVLPFSEGLAGVWNGKVWGFIDLLGAEIIAPQFDRVKAFSSGLAAVEKGGRWYYINRGNQTVIPGPFLQATPFALGLAHVQLSENRWAWLDERGKVVFTYRA